MKLNDFATNEPLACEMDIDQGDLISLHNPATGDLIQIVCSDGIWKVSRVRGDSEHSAVETILEGP